MIVHKSNPLARIMQRMPRWFGQIEVARVGYSLEYRRVSFLPWRSNAPFPFNRFVGRDRDRHRRA